MATGWVVCQKCEVFVKLGEHRFHNKKGYCKPCWYEVRGVSNLGMKKKKKTKK